MAIFAANVPTEGKCVVFLLQRLYAVADEHVGW